MTLAEARLHLRYSAWASIQLVEVVRSVPDADFEKNVGISHGSMLGTLAHILWADWMWFNRIAGQSAPPGERPAQTREALETVWPVIHDKWIAWAVHADDAEIHRLVEYISILDGKLTRVPAWQIILHVVNHATLHRGQVVGLLRQMGIAPPHTDLMNFYREPSAVGHA